MMQSFSPLTRRIVALGLLIFLLLAAANIAILLVSLTTSSITDLRDARFREARLAALKARPLPEHGDPVPPGLVFNAPNREAAAQMVAATVNGAAASVQLPLEGVAIAPEDSANPLTISLSLSASGPESAVLNFVAELEKKRPIMRLRSWKIARTTSQPPVLHIEAQAEAVWSAGS